MKRDTYAFVFTAMTSQVELDLVAASLREITSALQQGTVTSVQLVERYLSEHSLGGQC